MKYIKKPVAIEATQWFKSGDHPKDDRDTFYTEESGEFLGEGKTVRYYRRPDLDGQDKCKNCSDIMHNHGWIDTLEGGHIVCPKDYIIKGIKGEFYPCKPDIFVQTYEKVEDLKLPELTPEVKLLFDQINATAEALDKD